MLNRVLGVGGACSCLLAVLWLVAKMICDTVRSKVCEKMSSCKGLALMKTYFDALVCVLSMVTIVNWSLMCLLVRSFGEIVASISL